MMRNQVASILKRWVEGVGKVCSLGVVVVWGVRRENVLDSSFLWCLPFALDERETFRKRELGDATDQIFRKEQP